MAQIIKKFIGDNQVADEKIRLDNDNYLRARNAANSGDVNIVKIDSSDQAVLAPTILKPSTNNTHSLGDVGAKFGAIYVGQIDGDGSDITIFSKIVPDTDNTIDLGSSSLKFKHFYTNEADIKIIDPWPAFLGVNVAALVFDGTTSQTSSSGIAGIFMDGEGGQELTIGTFERSNSADTNYVVLRTGRQTGAAGNSGYINLSTGDSANGNSGWITLGTGAAPNGTKGKVQIYLSDLDAGNMYWDYVNSRLRVKDTLRLEGTTSGFVGLKAAAAAGSTTYELPSADGAAGEVLSTNGSGILSWVAAGGATFNKETFTLSAGDITNQYIDLANVAKAGSIQFIVRGGGVQMEGASYDYTVNLTGGAGGNTRLTFVNDLATGGASALVAGDILQIQYAY